MHPLQRRSDLVIQETGGEMLVYDLKTHKAKVLNETAHLVWRNCDGKRSPKDLSSYLSNISGQEFSIELVEITLEKLREEALLDWNGAPLVLGNVSRREALRKVGLSTLLALPMISVITAPASGQASSTCIPLKQGCNCVSGQCNGRQGLVCATSTPCSGTASQCRCVCAGNGGTNGDCVV